MLLLELELSPQAHIFEYLLPIEQLKFKAVVDTEPHLGESYGWWAKLPYTPTARK